MKNAKKRMVKIGQVISAWETLAADKSFSGMTLDVFKKTVQPALDAQDKVIALRTELLDARAALGSTSLEGHTVALQVIDSVKGDAGYGADSSLYGAMGYVRLSERKTGLTRKTASTAAPTPTPAA